MASTAVLERAPRIETEARAEQAAQEHNQRMKEAYRLLMSETPAPAKVEAAAAPVYNAPVLERPAMPVIERPALESAPEIARPARPTLFDNYEYKDGKLYRMDGGVATVVTPAPATEEESEDARPTQRTLDALRRPMEVAAPAVAAFETPAASFTVVEEHTAQRVGFFASLSRGMKIARVVIAVFIVVAVAVLIVNNGVISGLDASIAERQAVLSNLSQTSQVIRERMSEVTDPSYVDWFAEHVLNMFR